MGTRKVIVNEREVIEPITPFSVLILLFLLPLGPVGISFKTQALYATVFLTRYTDLFSNFQSLYNTAMKVFFIASSLYIVYLMRFKYKATNDPRLDTFKVHYVVGGTSALALIANYAFTVQEVK